MESRPARGKLGIAILKTTRLSEGLQSLFPFLRDRMNILVTKDWLRHMVAITRSKLLKLRGR